MESTSRCRALSSPDLVPSSTAPSHSIEDYSLEGIATNVKLLLKLIQDHSGASTRDHDDRKTQRVAGMMTILDDIKTRIEKSQTAGRRRMAELRRCNTDLRPVRTPRDKKPPEATMDEKEKLRRQLNASLLAQKSLAMMCSSLGKEKGIIASELTRKVNECNEMEELVNDLKAQNEMLVAKVQALAAAEQQKEKRPCAGGEAQGNAALQERNKTLSDQLLKSLDSYRALKRKYKDAKEENVAIRETMEEIGIEVETKLEQIRNFRRRMACSNDRAMDIDSQISALEQLFDHFSLKISRHADKNTEGANRRAHINSNKPPVLA